MDFRLSPQAHIEGLIEALPYIQTFRGETFVIKYGGSAMEDEHLIEKLLRDVVFLEAIGINPVLVHGGGKAISAKMRAKGKTPHFVNGLRVTDARAIQFVEQTLDHEVNPYICTIIQRLGGKCIGLSGRNVFFGNKLPPQPQKNGSLVDVGFVGDAAEVDASAVKAAIQAETIPVISPIGSDLSQKTSALNINADLAAAKLAMVLEARKLIYVSDVPGVMRDRSVKDSLIPTITSQQAVQLIEEQVIEGGMIPKVKSAIRALEHNVKKVHFVDGHIPHCLLLEIFTNGGIGTEIIH